jgi:hypothetical protein
VGFLGAGLVVHDMIKDEITGHTSHTVRGIATAASVWLSAAVGIACGGGLYFSATFTCTLLMVLLRFGPRHPGGGGEGSRGGVVLPIIVSSALPPPEQRQESSEFVKFRGGAQRTTMSFH